MNDMTQAIVPKSDQLNSDDLIAGPITITITEVTIRGGQEQPVSIHYEGDNGKPYKSCKSMNRVLVAAWGPDATQYAGRRMTLYRDPKVKWAGMEVGGIRISHLSHIDAPMTMALTATKGSRKPYTVNPIAAAPNAQHDWSAEINAAPDLPALVATWKRIPTSLKSKYEAIKDARKSALSEEPRTEESAHSPAPGTPTITTAAARQRIGEIKEVEILDLYMDGLPDEIKGDLDVQKAFKARRAELVGK